MRIRTQRAAVLGEPPSAWQLAGCALVLASVLMARR
jgi:drug/metabolite transporter (DMT)-like permease